MSSVLDSPRTRRATISCWICWVPSKMSRILESRAHFSSSSASLKPTVPHSSTQRQRDVGADPAGLGLGHRGLERVGLPVVGHPGGLQHQQPGALEVGLELEELRGRRRLGVRRPVVVDLDTGVLEQLAGQVERRRRAADRHRGHQRAGVVEGRHRTGEALLGPSISAEPSRFSFGTRQFSKMIVAVSEARMPSLCSSRSTRMPGRALGDHERLDRRPAELPVEGRPHHDGVGAVAGGDEDLLAVEDVLVAVEDRGRLDVRRVRAGAGLGDRHRRPRRRRSARAARRRRPRRSRSCRGPAAASRAAARRRPSTSPGSTSPRRGWCRSCTEPSSSSDAARGRRWRRLPRTRRTRRARRSSPRACRAPWGTRARRGRTCARSAAACSSRPGGPGRSASGTSSGRRG